MISPTGTGTGPSTSYYFGSAMKGMTRSVEQFNKAAGKIASGDLSPENMVDMMQSEKMVKASTVALRTQDEVIGTLLNIQV